MSRPIIGISCSLELVRDLDPPRWQANLQTAYFEAVYAGGGLPHLLPVPAAADDATLDELLDSIDALLLTGGDDLSPDAYGATPHPRTKTMPAQRNAFELGLFRRADLRRVPMLAICLGFQIAHVVRGGRLCQHVDDLELTPPIVHYRPRDASAYHDVRVAAESQLARVVGSTAFEVNSRHHQVIDLQQPGAGLKPVAWSPDGVLEASEDCADRFLLAVQWHPENLVDRVEHRRLFEALTEAGRQRQR